jgi:hypothetical protein
MNAHLQKKCKVRVPGIRSGSGEGQAAPGDDVGYDGVGGVFCSSILNVESERERGPRVGAESAWQRKRWEGEGQTAPSRSTRRKHSLALRQGSTTD